MHFQTVFHFGLLAVLVLPCPHVFAETVLVVNVRNWLYLVTVAYKISRRIALLAPAPFRARLSGAGNEVEDDLRV